ncbi:MAG: hypothetical protein KatS3mg087_1297 [Patescibacteria group bacterium]|nr:MAG: hypothetical protein KatS3mg087_1297 [Patescibacteria group bacterium]
MEARIELPIVKHSESTFMLEAQWEQGHKSGPSYRLWTKVIIPKFGTFRDMLGQEVQITPDLITSMVAESNRYLADGHDIPFQDTHSDSALDTIGYVTKFELTDEGLIKAYFKITDEEINRKLETGNIKNVSPSFAFEYTDSENRTYKNVILHVAATPYPAITPQDTFVAAFSRILNNQKLRETEMSESLKELCVCLGADPNTATPDVLLSKVHGLLDALKTKDNIINSYQELEKRRHAKEREAFLEGIKQKCVALGAPIEEEKLEIVRSLFDKGLEEHARAIANDYLRIAELSARSSGALVKAEDPAEEARRKAEEEVRRMNLEAAKILGIQLE